MTEEILERANDISYNIKQLEHKIELVKPYIHKNIEIVVHAEGEDCKITERNVCDSNAPYMAAAICKVLQDERERLKKEFAELNHNEKTIEKLESERDPHTNQIKKCSRLSKLISKVFEYKTFA